MFDRDLALSGNIDVIGVPDNVRASWSSWLDGGWNGVKVAEWASQYLPSKLEADLKFLDEAVKKMPAFARAAQRQRREAVGQLVRGQHLLPWTTKKKPQFFTEQRGSQDLVRSDSEHGFPVSQIKSLVLMAIEAGDVEQARKRLVYCWLIPTVNCTKHSHRALPKRCENFDRPLDRYSSRHESLQEIADTCFSGVAMTIRRFDGTVIDPDHYSRSQLLKDLQSVEQLRPIIDSLDGLTFPEPAEEAVYTMTMQKRAAKHIVS